MNYNWQEGQVNWDEIDWERQEGGAVLPPPQVVADPALVRAVMDYRVYEAPEDLVALRKPLTWFMAGNGIVPVRKAPQGVFVGMPVGASSLPGLPILAAQVQLACPKVPWTTFLQVIVFFQAINVKMQAEALVQVFWDPVAGVHVVHIPPQEVSGGGVNHTGHFDKAGMCWHLMDIHSHNTMPPFWSATDDRDEARFEGRLFGVVGHVDHAIPEVKWRTRIGAAFVDLTLQDVVDTVGVPPIEVTVTKRFEIPGLIEVASGGTPCKDNTQFFFTVNPFEDVTYPAEWEAAVTDRCGWLEGEVVGMTPAPFSRVEFKGKPPDEAEGTRLKSMGLVQTAPGVWERPDNDTEGAGYVFDRSTRTLYCRNGHTKRLFKSIHQVAALINAKMPITFVDTVDPAQIGV